MKHYYTMSSLHPAPRAPLKATFAALATSLIVLLVVSSFARVCAADSVVIVGAGEIGAWRTELTFANPSDLPSSFAVSTLNVGPTTCLPVCPIWNLSLPPHGSQTVSFRAFYEQDFPLNSIFVTPADGSVLPVVSARIINQADACQSDPLPTILLSTLQSSAGQPLIFAGVTKGDGAHSNLAVGGVGPDGLSVAIRIRAQLFSADGTPVGEKLFSNEYVNGGNIPAAIPILVVDVAGQLGVDAIQGGQLVVSLVSGDASLWGAVATVSPEGSLSITAGRNP